MNYKIFYLRFSLLSLALHIVQGYVYQLDKFHQNIKLFTNFSTRTFCYFHHHNYLNTSKWFTVFSRSLSISLEFSKIFES